MIQMKTRPYADQKPGTSGLRKKVQVFQQPGYLENFVQSVFEVATELRGGTLVIGGDGRFYNDEAIQIILSMAVANGVKKAIVGKAGLLSTPAVSHLIRKYKAQGGLVLTASHNPGGPDKDFGIKLNTANGGSANETITQAIFEVSQHIETYQISESLPVDLNTCGASQHHDMVVEIIDPVEDYVALVKNLFDFEAIRGWLSKGHSMRFDAMHAVTGPFAKAIFVDALGAPESALMNETPLPDFGGQHPDPNSIYARALFNDMFSKNAPDFGAASDGDGDRNIVLGQGIYVSPSDSVAVIAANAHLVPAYSSGISGVARSMPTSAALDRVAESLGVESFETPTGWKFFGNLLDAGRITICGEESAGASSDHIREKDGLWAVLMWLNILAVRQMSVQQIMTDHWQTYGRNYYARHDYEAIEVDKANAVMAHVTSQLDTLPGQIFGAEVVKFADSFTYHDPIDGSISENQGLRIGFESGSRIVLRLSGTGTVGATLRLYLERYEKRPDHLALENHAALETIVKIAHDIARIETLTGQARPTLIS